MTDSSDIDSDVEAVFNYSDEKWTDLKMNGQYEIVFKGLINEIGMFLPDNIFDYDNYTGNGILLIARYTLDIGNVLYDIFVHVCDLDYYEEHNKDLYKLLKQGICPSRYSCNLLDMHYNKPLFKCIPSDVEIIECNGKKCRLSGKHGVWCESCNLPFEVSFDVSSLNILLHKKVLFSNIPPSSIIYIEKS